MIEWLAKAGLEVLDALTVAVAAVACGLAGGAAALLLWGLSAWAGFDVAGWVYAALPIGGGLAGLAWGLIEVRFR